ncbi:FAD-binding oxidoreductase [Frankia sp. CNm7]|uniref:FAD-binding oxidoreductase n=1 Tax=Frankia nepalensis TaxID=1836974 RepID=A0A937URB9_9ACTN|nr:FAD-binding oxidoreductase [Frankia nepalensis]MBL7496760.1 FAD-binding oxidoreductase [Frankia nepalensis]MBL7510418.1 FAD-binding oxidoreductase [Frankia nepalensis]MBL7521012.1 FAD-binding oxidoreductase [Frankia nepalensis]MBL7630988.1 FAD-binding oxidoreductase [Frankia nepalensis]
MVGVPDRRTVLRAGLAGLAGGLLPGCSSDGPPEPGPSPRPTPSAPATLDPAQSWESFARQLTGRLVRPGDADYDRARALFDPKFDTVRPQGVVYAANPEDVAAAVRFAEATGVGLAARCGGHSYGGYSTSEGLVVDVTEMNQVSVDAAGIATVGAGARLLKVYTDLAGAGRTIPAGSCPTVGVTGLALGGGIGVLGRLHGLTCDRLTGATVVLASGERLEVDEDRDADLFWALRGGGGNFGIVTELRFETRAARSLTLFSLRWPWSAAPDVLAAWQNWVIGGLGAMPDELWSTLVAGSAPGGSAPTLRLSGVYAGARAGLFGPLADLRAAVPVAPASTSITEHDHLAAMRIEAGCSPGGGDCGSTDGIQAGARRPGQHAASAILTAPVGPAGNETFLRMIEERQRDPLSGSGGIILDAWGGAIGRVGPAETAFVHRDAIASVQYFAGYPPGATAEVIDANRAWLRDTVAAGAPHVSGRAYQNYIDPELTDWAEAYYGANLPRLTAVKRHYDPDNLFHFAQSIPLD